MVDSINVYIEMISRCVRLFVLGICGVPQADLSRANGRCFLLSTSGRLDKADGHQMNGVKAGKLMKLTNNLINNSEMRITKGANHQTCKAGRRAQSVSI